MLARVKNTIKTRDGVVCFTAGKVYNVREDFYTPKIGCLGVIHSKSTGLVSTIDDRGEPSALMFSEFEVTCEDRHSNYR